ncbi:MAG: YhbY family RNA-binding protein, partial [Oscillospiraceae bacterium]
TTKQRAKLRGYANSLEVILQIGKSGVTSTVLKQVNDALAARELVKGKVLDNSLLSAREVAVKLAEDADAEIVQVIGSKFVLYKQKKKDAIYEI